MTAPPPRYVCEERRYVDRCPVTTCKWHVAGTDKPLKRLPVCGRVLIDCAVRDGGWTREAIGYFLDEGKEQVRWIERTGLKKAARRLQLLGE